MCDIMRIVVLLPDGGVSDPCSDGVGLPPRRYPRQPMSASRFWTRHNRMLRTGEYKSCSHRPLGGVFHHLLVLFFFTPLPLIPTIPSSCPPGEIRVRRDRPAADVHHPPFGYLPKSRGIPRVFPEISWSNRRCVESSLKVCLPLRSGRCVYFPFQAD